MSNHVTRIGLCDGVSADVKVLMLCPSKNE